MHHDLSQIRFWTHAACLTPQSSAPPPPSPTHLCSSHFSFDVSLTCGRDSEKEEPPYDVALKLNARFTDRQFLRSARVSGKWVGEEASTAYFPFIPDQPFRVGIIFGICDEFPWQVGFFGSRCEEAQVETRCWLNGFIYKAWDVLLHLQHCSCGGKAHVCAMQLQTCIDVVDVCPLCLCLL